MLRSVGVARAEHIVIVVLGMSGEMEGPWQGCVVMVTGWEGSVGETMAELLIKRYVQCIVCPESHSQNPIPMSLTGSPVDGGLYLRCSHAHTEASKICWHWGRWRAGAKEYCGPISFQLIWDNAGVEGSGVVGCA